MNKYNDLLTEIVITLREFPGRMSNPEIDAKIEVLLNKTVTSIGYGNAALGEKNVKINILTYTDGEKVALINGNLWPERDEDYLMIYVSENNSFYRMEQSGAFQDYTVSRKWEDLEKYLKELGFNPQIVEDQELKVPTRETFTDFTATPVLKPEILGEQIF